MSSNPATPPRTTFAPTNTPSGAAGSPAVSPKPKEKWTTRVGTIVKRRSLSRRSSLTLPNNNTPGEATPNISDSASEKEKASLVDNLVRKASRRLSFSRSSATENVPMNPKRKPSIDLQRSVTIDVDLPTTASTSSLSLDPAHQINGNATKLSSSAMLAVELPSPIAESPLREADALMQDTLAAEGGRAAGGRFISMSSMKPEIEVAPPVPTQLENEVKEEKEEKEQVVAIEPVPIPTISIHLDEPLTPPALSIPPVIPYVAPVVEQAEILQALENEGADQDLGESVVIVNHPDDAEEEQEKQHEEEEDEDEEKEFATVAAPQPVQIVEPVVEHPIPTSVTVEDVKIQTPIVAPVITERQVPEPPKPFVFSPPPPVESAPQPSSSELRPATPPAPQPIVEKHTPFPKSSSTNISHSYTPTPTPPPPPPQSWSAVKVGSSILAASVAVALAAYALTHTGVIPSSSLPWITAKPSSSFSLTGSPISPSSSMAALSEYIPDFSFLSSFPFNLNLRRSGASIVPEGGWGAETIAIAADAASLVVDAAVDSVSAGAVGGGMSGGVATGAVAGTGVLAVVGAGLAKFGSMFWSPWRAHRRGS